MDSLTHLHFADRLLGVADCDRGALACALFPQIDRVPAYYHRLYAHQFAQIPRIIEAAVASDWWSEDHVTRTTGDYFTRRLSADRTRILGYVASYWESTSGAAKAYLTTPPREAAILATASHLFSDMFNNPVQAFMPWSPYPSGMWNVWQRIDGVDYRWILYQRHNIEALRLEVFAEEDWAERVPAPALTAAIIDRVAANCTHPVADRAVRECLDLLGIDGSILESVECQRALSLLRWHENALDQAIVRYSAADRAVDNPQWSGDGQAAAGVRS